MREIGGFFGLEEVILDQPDRGQPEGATGLHPGAFAMAYGRSCLYLILKELRPNRVFVPYYSCDSVIEPIRKAGSRSVYYAVDQSFKPLWKDEAPGSQDSVLYINYFGLQGATIHGLYQQFGELLILDNSQAFFSRPTDSIWAFNSARKFFGVPDGAYLYHPRPLSFQAVSHENVRIDYLENRAQGRLSLAFSQYQESEAQIPCELTAMSEFTRRILSKVDYAGAAAKRKVGFDFYHSRFGGANRLLLNRDPDSVPFCYPFFPEKHVDRNSLYVDNVFVPRFWPDCLARPESGFTFELALCNGLLPLPLDQRMTSDDYERVANLVWKLMK